MHKLRLGIGVVFSGICSASLAADERASERPSLDSNGDGIISFVEFQESNINDLSRLDTDQNGVLTLDEFLKTEIFEPLNMLDTGFYVPSGKKSRLASCYQHRKLNQPKLVDDAITGTYLSLIHI